MHNFLQLSGMDIEHWMSMTVKLAMLLSSFVMHHAFDLIERQEVTPSEVHWHSGYPGRMEAW